MITPMFEYERVSRIVTNWGILPAQKRKAVLASNLPLAQKQQLLALIPRYTAPPPWHPSYPNPGNPMHPLNPRSQPFNPLNPNSPTNPNNPMSPLNPRNQPFNPLNPKQSD